MLFKKDEHIVTVTDPNTFNVFIRAGFEPIESDEKSELLSKAKELGIKGAHLMSIETLKEKINSI